MTSKTLLRLSSALAVAGLATVLLSAPASADMINYAGDLKGSNEVPPNTVTATGSVTASVDTATKKLTYTVTYSGLTGTATAAHFHGPALASANAPPVIPVSGSTASPIKGEATLTDAQLTEFAEGKMYFNVHTAANPGGEIRGQVTKK